MEQHDVAKVGRVYLVGAGPGDPGLITVRGLQCLARADVVLYDYLANPQLLEHAPPSAELICLGRHGRSRIWTQSEINAELVRRAQQGQTVVRLKGGDPAVFARAAEEADTLERAGIQFEIVPGITASLAAGSFAGIPLTHRDHASAVALITGQENPAKDDSALDYRMLAAFPGTLVFYMGVTTAPQWSSALLAAGKPADTPVAIIRRCSLPDQTTLRCTLSELAEGREPPVTLRPPVLFIVGQVVQAAAGSWFERRPLFGRTVLVTRPLEQSETLRDDLAEWGARVLVQPAIKISDPADPVPLERALADLAAYDWMVFSSANGARHLLRRLLNSGRDLRALGSLRIAAIGPGTAQALEQFHLRADLIPVEYRAEALADALAADAAGRRFLLVRASRGREVLGERLREAGGQVEQVVAYASEDIETAEEEVFEAVARGHVDWITVTSSAIARSLCRLFGRHLQKARLVSISPITSDTLRELGYPPAVEAREYTMSGVVRAILDAERR